MYLSTKYISTQNVLKYISKYFFKYTKNLVYDLMYDFPETFAFNIETEKISSMNKC